MNPDDICPQPIEPPQSPTVPHSQPISLSTVYRCTDPAQADFLLGNPNAGYVYIRDHHPNGDVLAEKCRLLHAADWATTCGSGMSAIAGIVISQLAAGDHLVISSQLYGRSLQLLTSEVARFGIRSTTVDTSDLAATAAAFEQNTKLLVVETITNPLLRVSDIQALAQIAHRAGARLVVDNTFACPLICRPLEHGADLVFESITKIVNGHSDVLLGLICGRQDSYDRVALALIAWGLSSSPFDCWLAERGLQTLAVRVDRANANALTAATHLSHRSQVESVSYPGLPSHPDHELASRQFQKRFGAMVTFHLKGGLESANRFIAAASRIPFCPSLGDLNTTLSHPQSTSHRLMSESQRQSLGIFGGTIRLSVGIESPEFVTAALDEGLNAL